VRVNQGGLSDLQIAKILLRCEIKQEDAFYKMENIQNIPTIPFRDNNNELRHQNSCQ
jgi:hypothetical protein